MTWRLRPQRECGCKSQLGGRQTSSGRLEGCSSSFLPGPSGCRTSCSSRGAWPRDLLWPPDATGVEPAGARDAGAPPSLPALPSPGGPASCSWSRDDGCSETLHKSSPEFLPPSYDRLLSSHSADEESEAPLGSQDVYPNHPVGLLSGIRAWIGASP